MAAAAIYAAVSRLVLLLFCVSINVLSITLLYVASLVVCVSHFQTVPLDYIAWKLGAEEMPVCSRCAPGR